MRAILALPLCLTLLLSSSLFLAGCGGSSRAGGGGGGGGGGADMASSFADLAATDGSPQMGCMELQNCYTVYAHSDHVLYHIDLANKALVRVGPFNAPKFNMSEDVITDLAVAPDNTIYTISKNNLYTADPKDGHVTVVGPVTTCGMDSVALTTTPDGSLYAADYKGAFCKIDISAKPPRVTQVGTLGNGLAIAGDIVAVKDGTMFGTAYTVANAASDNNDVLVTIDPTSGKASAPIGPTGYPKLFGIAFAMGQVFGFTHDGSGHVITIDPKTGKGTLFNTFLDPMTNKGISFAGAGVNSMVEPPPVM